MTIITASEKNGKRANPPKKRNEQDVDMNAGSACFAVADASEHHLTILTLLFTVPAIHMIGLPYYVDSHLQVVPPALRHSPLQPAKEKTKRTDVR